MISLLNDLNVIITRPIEQAQSLKEKVLSLGGVADIFPTIAIEPIVGTVAMVSKLLQDNQFDYIIFTSRNAVTPITSVLSAIRSAQIFAIGPATAHALQQFDLAVQKPQEKFDSEHLLNLFKTLKIKQKQIAIFAGEGGRTYLEEQLTAMGGCVTKCALYRRVLPTITKSAVQAVIQLSNPIIISTSCESIDNLYNIMQRYNAGSWLFKTITVVISERMKSHCLKRGFRESLLLQADNATDNAILECIIKWYSTSL